MSTKKYEIVKSNSIFYSRKKLHRIRALKSFNTVDGKLVKKGELGGFVESENNLSQERYCWIFNNAKVYDDAKILDDAIVNEFACVFDSAVVCGKAKVHGKAQIFGNAKVFGDAKIFGNAWLYGVAKIGDGLNLNKGEYIFKSLNVEETLNEIKPICGKVDFVNKAIKSNFPVEESYIENLISQFAEYSELLANFLYEKYDKYIDIFPEGIEIYELLLQGKANVEMLKNKTKGEEI